MAKAPEEGEIWEWRAFGDVSAETAARVRAHRTRMGLVAMAGDDIYFVSETSDQNVKLRKWGSEWVLKFKLLLKTARRSIELYKESAGMVYRFPVSTERLTDAARMLEVRHDYAGDLAGALTREEFTQSLEHSSPPALRVEVAKVRSQFEFDGGWIELADVVFPRLRVQSISIHSPRIEAVEEMLDRLQPGPGLEVMNYVEACRRWGR